MTLAGVLPRPGGRLAYRYDFGDCWDHDVEVEKVHQAAKNTTHPRCPAGGRACPPEDSGGPEGFAAHLWALGHRKGWKYAQAREVFGSGRWDGAAWDKAEVNAELAALAGRWAQRAADQARAEQPAAVPGPIEASPGPVSPGSGRPGNGSFAGHRVSLIRPPVRSQSVLPVCCLVRLLRSSRRSGMWL